MGNKKITALISSAATHKQTSAGLFYSRVPRQSLLALDSSAPAHQVNDRDDDRNHKQNVDQTSSNMEAEPKQPKHQQNRKYGPQHSQVT
jgi:hypothetical protein